MGRGRSSEPAVILVVVALLTCGVLLIFAVTEPSRAWRLVVVPVSAIAALIGWALFGGRRPAFEPSVRGSLSSDGSSYRVLVVADESCRPDDLRHPLVHSADDGVTEAFVVAPALAHLEKTVAALKEVGIDARGHLGSSDPIEAADEALREFPADELVFATRRAGDVNRLEADLLELARSRFRLPVRQLEITQPG